MTLSRPRKTHLRHNSLSGRPFVPPLSTNAITSCRSVSVASNQVPMRPLHDHKAVAGADRERVAHSECGVVARNPPLWPDLLEGRQVTHPLASMDAASKNSAGIA